MFTWPIKWILKKILVAIIPALIAIGLLDAANIIDVEAFVNELLGMLNGADDETTTAETTTAA